MVSSAKMAFRTYESATFSGGNGYVRSCYVTAPFSKVDTALVCKCDGTNDSGEIATNVKVWTIDGRKVTVGVTREIGNIPDTYKMGFSIIVFGA